MLKKEIKNEKAEYDRKSRGVPREAKQQHRVEQEAEFTKKACNFALICTRL